MTTLSFSVALLGDATQPLDFTQLGVAGVLCALLLAISWTLWRQHLTDSRTVSELQAARLADMDKVIPVLGKCVEVLTVVARATEKDAMERELREKIAGEK